MADESAAAYQSECAPEGRYGALKIAPADFQRNAANATTTTVAAAMTLVIDGWRQFHSRPFSFLEFRKGEVFNW